MVLWLGWLVECGEWQFKCSVFQQLCDGILQWVVLGDEYFELDMCQIQVDMKIGIDIVVLVYKKQVDQIILVVGDVDFIFVVKLVCYEGIDFIFDLMWQGIVLDLYEYIDGLQLVCLCLF